MTLLLSFKPAFTQFTGGLTIQEVRGRFCSGCSHLSFIRSFRPSRSMHGSS